MAWCIEHAPEALAQTPDTPVKVIALFVAGELVEFAIDGKSPGCNAIGESPDHGTHVGPIILVLREAVQLQDQRPATDPYREAQRVQDGPVGQHLGLQTIVAAQPDGFHAPAVCEPAEMTDHRHVSLV